MDEEVITSLGLRQGNAGGCEEQRHKDTGTMEPETLPFFLGNTEGKTK